MRTQHVPHQSPDPASLPEVWHSAALRVSSLALLACVASGILGVSWLSTMGARWSWVSLAFVVVAMFGIQGLISNLPADRLPVRIRVIVRPLRIGIDVIAALAALAGVLSLLGLLVGGGVGLMRA